MKLAICILRSLLGLTLVVFGLNKFLGFMPMPEMNEQAGAFMGALVNSGYIFPVVGGVLVVVGLLLLGNFFVPLALLLLAPISVNIVLIHVVLDSSGIVPAALVAILNVLLFFAYKPAYSKILSPRGCCGGSCRCQEAS